MLVPVSVQLQLESVYISSNKSDLLQWVLVDSVHGQNFWVQPGGGGCQVQWSQDLVSVFRKLCGFAGFIEPSPLSSFLACLQPSVKWLG